MDWFPYRSLFTIFKSLLPQKFNMGSLCSRFLLLHFLLYYQIHDGLIGMKLISGHDFMSYYFLNFKFEEGTRLVSQNKFQTGYRFRVDSLLPKSNMSS